jgi:hypothetical protein
MMVKPFHEWSDEEIEKTRQTALQAARVQRVLDEAARSSRALDALFASDEPPTHRGERAADPAPLELEREAPAANAAPGTQSSGGKRWTPKCIAEARAMRDRLRGEGHRDYMRRTAKHYCVSGSYLRRLFGPDEKRPRPPALPGWAPNAQKVHRLK